MNPLVQSPYKCTHAAAAAAAHTYTKHRKYFVKWRTVRSSGGGGGGGGNQSGIIIKKRGRERERERRVLWCFSVCCCHYLFFFFSGCWFEPFVPQVPWGVSRFLLFALPRHQLIIGPSAASFKTEENALQYNFKTPFDIPSSSSSSSSSWFFVLPIKVDWLSLSVLCWFQPSSSESSSFTH